MKENNAIKCRIVDVAKRMFLCYGTKSVSMDNIAAEAGMSKKTLYHGFENKDELVKTIMQNLLEESKEGIDYVCKEGSNPIEEAINSITLMQEMISELRSSFMYDVQKFHPETYSVFKKHKDEYILKVVVKNLERGIAEGLYRQDINIELYARLKIETVMLAFNEEIWKGTKIPITEIIKETNLNFMFGMVTPKGLKLIEKYLKQEPEPAH